MKKYSHKKKLDYRLLFKLGFATLLASSVTLSAIQYFVIKSYNKENFDDFNVDSVCLNVDYWGGDQRYIDTKFNIPLLKESPIVTHWGINDRETIVGYSQNISNEHKQQFDLVVEYYNNLFEIINPKYKFKSITCSPEECDIFIDYGELSLDTNANVMCSSNRIISSKLDSANILINGEISMGDTEIRFVLAHEFMHILYGSKDVNYRESKTASIYNYDDTSKIIYFIEKAPDSLVDKNSFVTLMPTDIATLIAIYGNKNSDQKHCEYINLLQNTADTCINIFGEQPYFKPGYNIPDCEICK